MDRSMNKKGVIKIVMYIVFVSVCLMTYWFYNTFIKIKEGFSETDKVTMNSSVNSSVNSNVNENVNENVNQHVNAYYSSIKQINTPTMNTRNNNTDPEPNMENSSVTLPNQKTKKTYLISTNSTDITDPNIETTDFFKDWSPYVKKWPCSMNVTGTFTECGPNAYNSC